MCYLNLKNNSFQYDKEQWEDLIEVDYSNEYIKKLPYSEVKELVKDLVIKLTYNEK